MAFPVVEATNTGGIADGSTSYAAPLPSGISSGDLLLVFVGAYHSSSAVTISTPSGWDVLFSSGGASTLRRFAAFYRVASGSEGSTLSFTFSTGAHKASVSYRISGYSGVPEANYTAATNSNPNPPSLSPSWGVADTLWLATAAGARSTSSPMTAPSGFAGLIQGAATASGQDVPRVASAQLESAIGTVDPGTFSPNFHWAAATVAIQGAAAGAARRMMHYRRLRI